MKSNNLVDLVISAMLIVIFGLAIAYVYNQKPIVIINNKSIAIEVANTQIGRQQGLSGRESLADNHGMLFIFNKKDNQVFYNKDMKFPIKVLWIVENQIIGISDLPVESGERTLIHSPAAVDFVLEITDKTFTNINIKPGDLVKIKNVKKTNK